MELEYHELLNVCDSLEINITEEQANVIESETKGQANSKLWYKYRAGRVTASRIKAVCHTDHYDECDHYAISCQSAHPWI